MSIPSIRTESGPIQCHFNAPNPSFAFRMTRNFFISVHSVHPRSMAKHWGPMWYWHCPVAAGGRFRAWTATCLALAHTGDTLFLYIFIFSLAFCMSKINLKPFSAASWGPGEIRAQPYRKTPTDRVYRPRHRTIKATSSQAH